MSDSENIVTISFDIRAEIPFEYLMKFARIMGMRNDQPFMGFPTNSLELLKADVKQGGGRLTVEMGLQYDPHYAEIRNDFDHHYIVDSQDDSIFDNPFEWMKKAQ